MAFSCRLSGLLVKLLGLAASLTHWSSRPLRPSPFLPLSGELRVFSFIHFIFQGYCLVSSGLDPNVLGLTQRKKAFC